MGMNSRKLSARTKQPGHDQTYRASEGNFSAFLRSSLNLDVFAVAEKPSDLRKMLPPIAKEAGSKAYGVVPEVSVVCKATGRKLYFEVKKQAEGGNADERACKHHTVQFQRQLKKFTGYSYHSFVTIMCEQLANMPKYVAKHPYFFEPNSYFCWKDYSDTAALRTFLERVILATIVDDAKTSVWRSGADRTIANPTHRDQTLLLRKVPRTLS